jgi:hypothetical protein
LINEATKNRDTVTKSYDDDYDDDDDDEYFILLHTAAW